MVRHGASGSGEVGTGAPRPEATKHAWSRHIFPAIVVLALGVGIYLNSFKVPFQFDDVNCLSKNPSIMDFSCFTDRSRLMALPISQDFKYNFILRPVSYFTFAVNYRLHGLDVWGYHAVNVILHLVNGLLVYALMHLALRTPVFSRREEVDRGVLRVVPLFAALIFVAHPLQTQAVTYIIQRFCPMATMFCLASLVLYILARLSAASVRSKLLYGGALVSAVLAMEAKEIAFTLPLNMALLELMFFTETWRKRLVLLAPFLVTMLIIPWKVIALGGAVDNGIDLVNSQKLSSVDYLMTQFGVIVKYLQLLLLPMGQNLDYDWPLRTSFFDPAVILPLGAILALVAAAGFLLKRSYTGTTPDPLLRLIPFGICWFLLTLSVESTIIPIADYIFEHRVYLPSVGMIMAFMASIAVTLRRFETERAHRIVVVSLGMIVVVLSALTVLRNEIWQNELTLWQDAARKSPNKARPHSNFGGALMKMARIDEAIRELRLTLQIEGNDTSARNNLGIALAATKQLDAAAEQFVLALSFNPYDPEFMVNLAGVQLDQGRLEPARENLEKALRIDPRLASAYVVSALLLERQGRIAEAVQILERAQQSTLREPMVWQVSSDLKRLRAVLAASTASGRR